MLCPLQLRAFALPLLLCIACSCPQSVTDAGFDVDRGSADVVLDAGFDASAFDGGPGVCTPPLEFRRDRFDGDSQRLRDADHMAVFLREHCPELGESSSCATVQSDASGVIDAVVSLSGDAVEGCADPALGLCVPTLIEEPMVQREFCIFGI
ncbi:MAG: hypothetical protein AB8H86_33315 [Polyangiales bacterium]